MPFSEEDKILRFFHYAEGKCECCGKQLVYENQQPGLTGAWHAHHVVPINIREDDSIHNMSVLCINDPENCHLNQGHGGNYSNVQPRQYWECIKKIK